jgi:hypothetical protein
VAGRIHNPLSTLVFVPIFLVILSMSVRSCREPHWQSVARLSAACGALMLCCLIATLLYQTMLDWHGRMWTGLAQRSLLFPALLWMIGLLAITKNAGPGND